MLGFATHRDAEHISSPARSGMVRTMAACLESAGLSARDIEYVNAHATGTLVGDAVEAQATAEVIGNRTPESSTKGLSGHTLAACGLWRRHSVS
jgi:3-oxoacyl-[acyl-carrier-protein] synthase II